MLPLFLCISIYFSSSYDYFILEYLILLGGSNNISQNPAILKQILVGWDIRNLCDPKRRMDVKNEATKKLYITK
jgi:hypothetical protein